MEHTRTYTDKEIRSSVRSFIVDAFLFGQEDDRLTDEASFMETGIIDSTGVLELMGFVEETFGLAVEEHEITPENLDSLRNICAYVDRKLADCPSR
jgi:acyl carrier protein